jgi:hypothetical protein
VKVAKAYGVPAKYSIFVSNLLNLSEGSEDALRILSLDKNISGVLVDMNKHSTHSFLAKPIHIPRTASIFTKSFLDK